MYALDFAPAPDRSARWSRDGALIGPAVALDGPTLRQLEELRIAFEGLFDRHRSPGPVVDAGLLRAMGDLLFETFVRGILPDLPAAGARGPHTLLVRSTDPAFLNLPWELVRLPGSDLPLGCDPLWAVLRVPGGPAAPAPPLPADPGPLRLLFLAAAPDGDVPLDYEQEEDAMLRATERLSQDVVVLPFAETGGIAELAELVSRHRPHVVHLSGHGDVDLKGVGWFLFEDERGRPAPEPAETIANRVFRGSAVRCVMLNACKTGQAAASGLAGRLVAAGVPVVLGWGEPVLDTTATRFAAAFYHALAAGERVPAAAAKARQEVWRENRKTGAGQELWDATFALPRLFAAGPDPDLVDRAAPLRPYAGPKTEPELLGDDIKGLREGFVGRRRLQQRLIPPLRDGAVTVAVLTGIGGMGKSTLATRAAGRLREAGFEVIGVKAFRGATPADAGRLFLHNKLLPALARPFLTTAPEVYRAIRNGEIDVADRVAVAVAEWKKRKLALVIDNFEDVLDDGLRIADEGLRAAYRCLTRDLTGGSRVIVTCRHLPADTPDPATARHLAWHDVKDFQAFELVKFLWRNKAVEARIRAGEIDRPLVERLHRAFGGTPGFLVQLRALLGTGDVAELVDDLPTSVLEEKRQQYCNDIMLPRLYGLLSPEARTAVSRLAVSEQPLPSDGLALAAGLPESQAVAGIATAANYGLAQVFAEPGKPTLYHVPGLIRGWLTTEDRLPAEARRAVDATLARFWKASYEKDRESDLQVTIEVELLACRTHAERAGLVDEFRWASLHLARRLTALAEWKAARGMLEEISEQDRDGPAWHQLATIDVHEGAYPAARDKLARSLAITQQIGDRAGEAATWHNLASIDLNEGAYPAARDKFARALATRQQIGDRAGEAATWHNLASIDLNEGAYPAARDKFARALAMRQQIGDRAGEAKTWHGLASIDLNEGAYPAARDKLARSLAIKQQVGDRAGEAATWHQLASIDLREGAYSAARDKYAKSLAMRQQVGDRAGEAATWYQLGLVAWATGRKAEAVRLIAVCYQIDNAIGHGYTKSDFETLSRMCADQGYSQEQFNDMLNAVMALYRQDRGAALLAGAFPAG